MTLMTLDYMSVNVFRIRNLQIVWSLPSHLIENDHLEDPVFKFILFYIAAYSTVG
jgi:hypothetical protein